MDTGRVYSQAVADAAALKRLVLTTEVDPKLGLVVAVFPIEAVNVVSGSAWQPSPGGRWRASLTFGEVPTPWFDTADEAIMYVLDGGPITKRFGYAMSYPKQRR